MSNPRGFVPRFMRVWRTQLFPPSLRVGVAVSAGRDSCVLAALLGRLKSHLGIRKMVFLHLDHGIRPAAERRRDAAVLRRLAAKFRAPLVISRARVRSRGKGLEDAARSARLNFFSREWRRHRLDSIALAHHLDDRIETFFLFLFRGSGCRGLSSPRAVETLERPPVRIVRPLLTFTRGEIAAYAEAERVEFHEDSTNADPRLLRNRIRRDLIPMLAEWLPQFKQAMAASLETLESEDEAISAAALDAFGRSLMHSARGSRGIFLDRARLRAWPPAVRARVLQLAALRLGVPGLLGGHRNLASLAKAVGGPASSLRFDLPGRAALVVNPREVLLRLLRPRAGVRRMTY